MANQQPDLLSFDYYDYPSPPPRQFQDISDNSFANPPATPTDHLSNDTAYYMNQQQQSSNSSHNSSNLHNTPPVSTTNEAQSLTSSPSTSLLTAMAAITSKLTSITEQLAAISTSTRENSYAIKHHTEEIYKFKMDQYHIITAQRDINNRLDQQHQSNRPPVPSIVRTDPSASASASSNQPPSSTPSSGLSYNSPLGTQPPLPPAPPADDISIQSIKSTTSTQSKLETLLQTITNNHTSSDKSLTIPKYTASLTNETALRNWYKSITSAMLGSTTYKQLLTTTTDGNLIANTIDPNVQANGLLYNLLLTKLSKEQQDIFRGADINSQGTSILLFLESAIRPATNTQASADVWFSELANIKYTMTTESLEDFTTKFSHLVQNLHTTNFSSSLDPSTLRERWLNAMPNKYFSPIRDALQLQQPLPPDWQHAVSIPYLFIASRNQLRTKGATGELLLPKEPKAPKSDKQTNNRNSHERPTNTQSDHPRYPAPNGLSINEWRNSIRLKIHNNESIAPEIALCKNIDATTCPLCLFKPTAPGDTSKSSWHTFENCRLHQLMLKDSSNNSSNNNRTVNPYKPLHVVSTPAPAPSILTTCKSFSPHSPPTLDKLHQMIYDTGCFKHLVCNKLLFSNLTIYAANANKFIALGDEKTLLPVLGEGDIDIIIGTHRVILHGYYVPSLPTNIFSPSEHYSYLQCSSLGGNNATQINFPTFAFHTSSHAGFSFTVNPATDSDLHAAFHHTTNPKVHSSVPLNRIAHLIQSHLHLKPSKPASTFKHNLHTIEESEFEPSLHLQSTSSPSSTRPSPPLLTIIDNETDQDSDTDHSIHISALPPVQTATPSDSPVITVRPSSPTTTAIDWEDVTPPPSPKTVHPDAFDFPGTTDHVNLPIPPPIPPPSPSPAASVPVPPPPPTTPAPSPSPPASISDPPPTTPTPAPSPSPSPQDSLPDSPSQSPQSQTTDSAETPITWTFPRSGSQFDLSDFAKLDPTIPASTSKLHITPSELASVITSILTPAPQAPPLPHSHVSTYSTDTHTTTSQQPLIPTLIIPEEDLYPTVTSIPATDTSIPDPITSSTFQKPLLRPLDKVSNTVPNNVTLTSELLQKITGFRNIHSIISDIKELAADTVNITDIGRDPIKSRGETATMNKKKRNTTPVTSPDRNGDIIHYDIGYGNGTAIGGIRYALFLVDRKSRHKYVYPLKDMHDHSITFALSQFIVDLGRYPTSMIADRDFKLIGDHVKHQFQARTNISGATANRQNENGLSEANWKYICNIARNYMTENLLPAKFWYHGIRYAVQLSNYLPIKCEDGTKTTPHFEMYGIKPDYRKLIPLFSTSYVKCVYSSDTTNTHTTQTVKAILIGNDNNSNGRLFYNPSTRSVICSNDYTLDPTHPSGPLFNLKYDGGLQFNLLDDSEPFRSPEFEPQQTIYLPSTHPDYPSQSATILTIPSPSSDVYTIQLPTSGSIIEVDRNEFTLEPERTLSTPLQTTENPVLELPWLQHNTKVTYYFPDHKMKTPKQGWLIQKDDSWAFLPGTTPPERSKKTPLIIPNFELEALSHFNSNKFSKGWTHFQKFLAAYKLREAQTFMARRILFFNSTDPSIVTNDGAIAALDTIDIITTASKVSAADLDCYDLPSQLKDHNKMSKNDKDIWDRSYQEEYLGLHDTTHTWDYITEAEYQTLKHVLGKPLPTMALSKVKFDENGIPSRAKYRIVVLGNLDPHDWKTSDCFAPVLSPLEMRLLISIAAQKKCIPKSGDFVQAFCQSILPKDEQYVCLPPKNCPFTPSKTYLLLRKTLYGLKRSPRHWYETAKKALQSLGLHCLPNAPCIFTGTLIEGEPPLYLGLYVDDFIYFSESTLVEDELQKRIENDTPLNVDFEGPVSHFLGLKFQITKHDDGNVDIFLSQEAATTKLIDSSGLSNDSTSTKRTPYRSGHPVDAIPMESDLPLSERQRLQNQLQTIVGSLNWLSIQTRPDIATITNIIAQYCHCPSPGHIDAAKHVIRYLKGTTNLGIQFSSRDNKNIESFVQYPVDPSQLLPLSDANWGPQDASVPKPTDSPILLDLWKSRSISGFIIWLGGPLHWMSKRQTVTARSSAESEIYAMDECTKALQHIANILKDLGVFDDYTDGPIPLKNDNAAAVQWSYNMTTKGLRYIQMRENAVKEQTALGFIAPEHQSGATNLSDLFTKEDKDDNHYCEMRDAVQSKPPPIHSQIFSNSSLNLSDDHPETLSYLLPHFVRSSSLRSRGGVEGQTVSPLATQ